MPIHRILVVGAAALALALPASAQAGTVTFLPGQSIAYQGAGGNETINVGVAAGMHFVETTAAIDSAAGCTLVLATRAECGPVALFIVATLEGDDSIDARQVTTTAGLQARSGVGADRINGTANTDLLSGEDGDDTMDGGAGNDTVDGGPGADFLDDGPGDDTVVGGAGGDTWHAGPGTDTFNPGDGTDTVDYTGRSAPVTITLNGLPDDGEAGEGDNVGADVEDVSGGAGNDRIVGNNLGDRLHGGAGNDSITAGTGEDRVEGQEGDDVLDTRDGRFDSVDCGPGADTLLADPGDSAENCEVAPDRDGDGVLNAADCAPDNPAIHPGAGEIVGNSVDEDCNGVAQYLRVTAPLSYSVSRRLSQSQAKFTKLTLSEIKPGDTIELRCTGGKKKGCPFTKKAQTGKRGKSKVNLVSLLKKRYLKRNAVLEIRVTRVNEIGRVQRLKITKRGAVKSELLCLAVGATKPAKCG